jgi:hypothetical protein
MTANGGNEDSYEVRLVSRTIRTILQHSCGLQAPSKKRLGFSTVIILIAASDTPMFRRPGIT